MDVFWLGHACFRLKGRRITVVIDPYPPSLGLVLPKLQADILLLSHRDPNHAYSQAVAGECFSIEGPGEYEIKDVIVRGIPSFHDSNQGAERGRNTVYVVNIDDVRVCHLGDLGHLLSADEVERLGAVDLLAVPVGGGTTLSASQAAELVSAIGPRFVVPMHYALPGLSSDLEPLDKFLKEMGHEHVEPVGKLTLGSAGSSEETRLVVLAPAL